jgi:hypothetical protein
MRRGIKESEARILGAGDNDSLHTVATRGGRL